MRSKAAFGIKFLGFVVIIQAIQHGFTAKEPLHGILIGAGGLIGAVLLYTISEVVARPPDGAGDQSP